MARQRSEIRRAAVAAGHVVSGWALRAQPVVAWAGSWVAGKLAPRLSPWFGAAGLVALYFSCQQNRLLQEQLDASFEPRLMVSQLIPLPTGEDTNRGGHAVMTAGTVWVKNVGNGEAIDVACTIVNPFSGKGERFPFWKPLNMCNAEPPAGESPRSPRYNSVLAPNAEREICVDQLEIDMRAMNQFLAAQCTYTDKVGRLHTPPAVRVTIPGTSYGSINTESDEPVRALVDQFRDDPAVKTYRGLFGERAPAGTPGAPAAEIRGAERRSEDSESR